jgi:hypothetical protein
MKNKPILLVFIFIWLIGETTQAHAFYSSYPDVLSQPLDILPQRSITINVEDETFYYCNGIFYQRIMRDQKYVVVPPPIGAVVFNIPLGYQLMLVDGVSYYVFDGVYYKRVLEGYKVIYPPV